MVDNHITFVENPKTSPPLVTNSDLDRWSSCLRAVKKSLVSGIAYVVNSIAGTACSAGMDGSNSMRVVMFGPPGAGKGSVSAVLSKVWEVPHISTGDMLREQIDAGTVLGIRVDGIISLGRLVDDDTMNQIVEFSLKERPSYILDGYPRTVEQAHYYLDKMATPRLVLNLQCPDDILTARMLARGRKGESEPVIRDRLSVYKRETEPVLAVFKTQKNVRTLDIDGVGSIGEVSNRIRDAVEGLVSRG